MLHRITRKHRAALEIQTLLCKYVCVRVRFSQQELQNSWYFTCLKILCFLFKQTILWKQHNCGKWLPNFFLPLSCCSQAKRILKTICPLGFVEADSLVWDELLWHVSWCITRFFLGFVCFHCLICVFYCFYILNQSKVKHTSFLLTALMVAYQVSFVHVFKSKAKKKITPLFHMLTAMVYILNKIMVSLRIWILFPYSTSLN